MSVQRVAAQRLLSAVRAPSAPPAIDALSMARSLSDRRCVQLGPHRRAFSLSTSARASASGRNSAAAATALGGSSAGASTDAPRTRNSRGLRPELPRLPNNRPLFIALALLGVGGWVAFAQFATNKERLASSAFRSALVQVKDSAAAQRALGDPIMLVPSLVGDPWISGSVNTMQGRVDLSFEVKGAKGKGRAYFTSIRQASHLPFEIIRFLLVTDNGDSISLLPD